jgi:hypothetical protein
MICPSCAAIVPPAVWKLVGGLVATPFFLVAAVVFAIRHADRALPPARSSSEPPPVERAPDGAPFA